ncbi:hypothetical protein [Wenzhouxiangella sp. EGI_FJ10409]|uniref:hypothetical protein n=1 Tax=Wenzhouxiangella sp. EGI_FJ10409 TaxID=3243767 RepID=UPI0035E02128
MNKLIASLFLLLTLPLAAQEASESGESANGDENEPLTTPSQRASESDYVVLGQLHVYKYEKKREVPVSGHSWFDVLVPYKVPMPVERMKVVEEGFSEGKCYFDNADLFGEMPRYLLFLNDDPDGDAGEVRGHPDGCAVPVATTVDNQYVVLWPIENMRFEADAEALVEEFEFHGPGSFIDLSDLVSYRRQEEIERLQLEPADDDRRRREIYRYTRGIPLSVFRSELIGSENLTRDRIQRGQ